MNYRGAVTRSSVMWKSLFSVVTTLIVAGPAVAAGEANSHYAAWENGPQKSEDFFPIAVWLQSPGNAPRYKAIGINLYVGLWSGPTQAQIDELKKYHMPVICGFNRYARQHLDEKIIVGWMHGDEPDNAQSLGRGKGYGPPIAPEKIVEDYKKIRSQDPTRPVLLNLGQGVAWDGWHGRGVRTNHSEDYRQYVQGGDIVSFDIYPAVHDKPAVAGKLWYVPQGVDRLRQWTEGKRTIWNCIECTHIGNAQVKPTPRQVKAEVWMSLIHGSTGLIYFSHQFQPRFIEAGLLADKEMAAAVGRINRQIHELAPVLNSPAVEQAVAVETDPAEVTADSTRSLPMAPVATMVKRHGSATYLFAVRMEDKPAKATFRLTDLSGAAAIEVLGEQRTLSAEKGCFTDNFAPYEVHLYRLGHDQAAVVVQQDQLPAGD